MRCGRGDGRARSRWAVIGCRVCGGACGAAPITAWGGRVCAVGDAPWVYMIASTMSGRRWATRACVSWGFEVFVMYGSFVGHGPVVRQGSWAAGLGSRGPSRRAVHRHASMVITRRVIAGVSEFGDQVGNGSCVWFFSDGRAWVAVGVGRRGGVGAVFSGCRMCGRTGRRWVTVRLGDDPSLNLAAHGWGTRAPAEG